MLNKQKVELYQFINSKDFRICFLIVISQILFFFFLNPGIWRTRNYTYKFFYCSTGWESSQTANWQKEEELLFPIAFPLTNYLKMIPKRVMKYSIISSSVSEVRNEVPWQDQKTKTQLVIVYALVFYILNPKVATYTSPSIKISFNWLELLQHIKRLLLVILLLLFSLTLKHVSYHLPS